MDFRFGTVRRKASLQMLPKYNAWFAENKGYSGDYNSMDYILVKGDLPDKTERLIPNFQKIKASGPWSLYQNKKLLTANQ